MSGASVFIIVGAYGSGKTELAINLARREHERGRAVDLIDLDIVNPYFRSRDARLFLTSLGLRVISSAAGLEDADLPALSPAIIGALQTPEHTLVFDVGGDPVGAKALARFHQLLTPLQPQVWLAVNPYRPEMRTPAKIAAMAAAVSASSRQRVTGFIANPNLGPETNGGVIEEGCRLVEAGAAEAGLPVIMTAVREDLVPGLPRVWSGELLPLHRYMLLPWEKAAAGTEEEKDVHAEAGDR